MYRFVPQDSTGLTFCKTCLKKEHCMFTEMFIFEGVWLLPPETMLFAQTMFRDSCLDHPPKKEILPMFYFCPCGLFVWVSPPSNILFEFFDLAMWIFNSWDVKWRNLTSIGDVTCFPNRSHTLIKFSVKMILGVWQNFSKVLSTSCDK